MSLPRVSIFLLACLVVGPSLAAEPASREAALRDALRYGLDGKASEQRERLAAVLSSNPDLVVARAHAGYVRQGKTWVSFEEAARQTQDLPSLAEYEARRREAPETAEGQLSLASWCQEQGLADQERAHLVRVLEYDPEHATARNRLGFVRQGRDWIGRDERRAADAREQAQRSAMQKWRVPVRMIVSSLSRRHGGSAVDVRERKKQLEKLAEITDPAAVPALEAELNAYLADLDAQPGSSEHKSTDVLVPLVRAIGRIPHPEAAEAMARLAVSLALTVPMGLRESIVVETTGPRYLSVEELRRTGPLEKRLRGEEAAAYREALTCLREYPRDFFVPLLLSGLASPIEGQFALYRERDGDIVVRLFYLRETEGRMEGQENRTTFNPQGLGPAGKSRSAALAAEQATRQIQAAHKQLTAQNIAVLHRNLRVTDVLRAVVDQPLSTVPDAWWNWWNEENEVYITGAKPLATNVYKQSVTVIAPPPPPPPSVTVASFDDSRKKDCLAAGTKIWTVRGLVAVDEVRPGDLVLAQHATTGELAYKPVLARTERPRGPLVEIHAGGEVFRTSGGHPFWVAEEGWVRARVLQPGQRLYRLGGAVAVERVTDASQSEPTYNLVVADFHTYFVGESRVLSHDNTVRRPTAMALPGLPPGR